MCDTTTTVESSIDSDGIVEPDMPKGWRSIGSLVFCPGPDCTPDYHATLAEVRDEEAFERHHWKFKPSEGLNG